MLGSLLLALPAALAAAPSGHDVVAIQAGTIHVVDRGRVVEGGGTILIRDGKIVSIDKTLAIPPDARVVDYGPDAVVVPGLVAADSTFGQLRPAERTAEPGLSALDNFDPYASYATSLAGGVTSAYLPPARGRLIAGQGAVVKLAGAPGPDRVISAAATIDGSVSADARSTPGYWEPPVPATVDVGLGVELPQLPRTTMGAIVALTELLDLAAGGAGSELYGPYAGPELAELVKAKRPWRMTANTQGEIRALLGFFGERGLPLVIDGGAEAGELAAEIAAAGVPVIVGVPVRPGSPPRDRGKGEDDAWPRFDTASKLAAANVPFALSVQSGVPSLRFAARLASRGGLDAGLALRAITQAPAEMLGVADRVGSLAPGRDADLVVLNGPPMDATSSVVATWVGGEIAWKAHETAATVLEVDELHLGDGHVLSPGQLLIGDGKILEVGARVGHPLGATVVRGRAAMPGMIDAMGHLGLEGSNRVPPTRFELRRLVEAGDATDRRVAMAGVTTVVMTPRGTSSSGAPSMAYKPAGADLDRMVVSDPTAVHLSWTEQNRLESGSKVRELLQKAVEYRQKWDEYAKELAEYTPPPPEPPKAEDDEKKSDDEADEKADDEKSDDDKKKDDDEDAAPAPLTGAWEGDVDDPAHEGHKVHVRLRLLEEEAGALEANLRCDAVSSELVMLEGSVSTAGDDDGEDGDGHHDGADPDGEHDEESGDDDADDDDKKKSSKDDEEAAPQKRVVLAGVGTRGPVTVEGTVEEPEKKKKSKKKKGDDAEEPEEEPKRRLVGTIHVAGHEIRFDLAQTSTEYPVARRPELRKQKPSDDQEPKGMPKPPRTDDDLEPLRHALEGKVAVVVQVERADEILACVDAFDAVGIRPILMGAGDAHEVIDHIHGKVRGVLLSNSVTYSDARMGTRKRNRFAELQSAGIPVAFHSAAEEGAADLPVFAAYAVSEGMSPVGALRALTSDAAKMFGIDSRVGTLAAGRDADVLLLDKSPLEIDYAVERVWVGGREIRER